MVREGVDVAIVSFGTLLPAAVEAGEALNATVVDMRWVKPLDTALLDELVRSHKLIVSVEDHQRMTGAGSAVNEYLVNQGHRVALLNLGLPDQFIHHGKREALLSQQGLDGNGIGTAIRQRLTSLPN